MDMPFFDYSYNDYYTGARFNSTTKEKFEEACAKIKDCPYSITWETKDEYQAIQKEAEKGVLEHFRFMEETRKTKIVEDFFKSLGMEPSLETLYQFKAMWFN